jgi:cytochrome P450
MASTSHVQALLTSAVRPSKARRLLGRAREATPLVQEALRSLVIHRAAQGRPDAPPLAGGHIPYIGYAVRYGLEGPELLRSLRASHGDMFALRLMGKHITFCLTHELIEHLYDAPYEEVSFLEALKFFPGFGTVVPFGASGPEDANVGLDTLRRFLAPRVYVATAELDGEVTSSLRKLARKPQLELRADLGRAIVQMSACLLAGTAVAHDDDFIEAMAAFDVLTHQMTKAVFTRRAVERACAGRERVEGFLRAAVAARRRTPAPDAPRDFIDAMLESRDPQGKSFSDAAIASDLLGYMFGTTANTPAAATMCLAHILQSQPLLTRVRRELDDVRTAHGDVLDAAALKKLTLLAACLNETLRMYAPGIHLRMLRRETKVGSYLLPKDALVAVSPYVLHHDDNVYTDPHLFDPDRFLDGPRLPASKPKALHFVPFGRGLHACIGRTLAHSEVLLTLARILSSYDVELLPPRRPLAPDWGTAGLATPKQPLFARLTPRSQGA